MNERIKSFDLLMQEARSCTLCAPWLPQPPRPVLAASERASVVIVGQAPGIKAHSSTTPWNDPSGDRLRDWLGMDRETFYDCQYVALIPMGFCFPGYKNGADAPPRKECAPTWHNKLMSRISPQLTLLVGRYAQKYYLPQYRSLTEAVQNQASIDEKFMVLPHPSGRNNRWLARHPWFSEEVLPLLKHRIKNIFGDSL